MKSGPVLASVLLACGCWAPTEGRLSADAAERQRFRGRIAQVEEQLTLRQIMDTLPRVLAEVDTSQVSVIGFPRDDSAEAAALGTAARQLWGRVSQGAGSIRLLIWAYRPDAGLGVGGTWSAARGTLWPEATDGRTCVLVEPRTVGTGFGAHHRGWLEGVLAPCIYRARFGPPGSAVKSWLERTRYSGVSRADWLWRPGAAGAAGADQWFTSGEIPTLPDLVRSPLYLLWLLRQGAGTPWYEAGPDQIRCRTAVPGSCQRAMLEVSPWVAAKQASMAGWLGEPGDRFRVIRPGVWISELIRTGGEGRFASWWKADQDLAGAFAAVYGAPMDQAVREFAGIDGLRRGDEYAPRLGPSIAGTDVLAAVAWIGLLVVLPLLGGAAASRGRR